MCIRDSLSTGIIFDGNALQNVTVFVSRKGHLISFISAPLFLWWFRFSRSTLGNFSCVPCPRPHRGKYRQNDVRDSHHQVPHLSHLPPRGPLPAHLTTAKVVPGPVPGSQAPHNNLLIKGITGRRPARGWKVRKTTDCRDSLHFRVGERLHVEFPTDYGVAT